MTRSKSRSLPYEMSKYIIIKQLELSTQCDTGTGKENWIDRVQIKIVFQMSEERTNHSIKDFKVTGSLCRGKKVRSLTSTIPKSKTDSIHIKNINNNKCYKSIEENSIEATKPLLQDPHSRRHEDRTGRYVPYPSFFIILPPSPLGCWSSC